jgi:hypothetical protein
MKKLIVDIIFALLIAAAIIVVFGTVIVTSGCIKWKVPVSNGKSIVHERWWSDASADKVDFFFQDPNVTVWIVVNDPCSSVNPGRLIITEPRTGINASFEAGKGNHHAR